MYAFFLILRQHLIPVVLVSLVVVIVSLLFIDVSESKTAVIAKERMNPYLLTTQGKTVVKSSNGEIVTVEIQQKKNIMVDDKIRTLAESAATIFWIDGSITRLGENTSISVLELKKGAGDSTQVDFSISEGKSWSNLARSLDPDSYFKQRFDNDRRVAAVRGTVFEVNVEKWYVHTESHAVVIQDEKGKYVSTVPDGKSVSTDNAEKAVETSALDTNWQAGNLKNDVVVAQERLASIKMKLQELTKKKNWIAKVQEFLRNLFGVNSMNLPITVNSSESGISLSIDQKKLTAKNSQELLAIYEAVSVLNASDDTVDSKIKLREAILKTLPEKDAKNYREIFSRATLFDIWDSFKANMPKNSKELQAQLEKYTKQSENTEEISRLQDSLNIDKIKMFNSRMEEWKSKGYDSLSDPEWFSKTFQVDSEKLFDIVNQANDTFDSTIKKINNSVDKGVKDIINKPWK